MEKYWVVIETNNFLGRCFLMSKKRLTRAEIDEIRKLDYHFDLNKYGIDYEESGRPVTAICSTTSKQKAEEILKHAQDHGELPFPHEI